MAIFEISKLLSLQVIPIYALGFLSFIATILEHWLNPKKQFLTLAWYIQEFIYTVISIIVALGFCLTVETSAGTTYIIVIISGLVGSTLVRQIRNKKEKIADDLIDKLEDKIDIHYDDNNKIVETTQVVPPTNLTEEQSS